MAKFVSARYRNYNGEWLGMKEAAERDSGLMFSPWQLERLIRTFFASNASAKAFRSPRLACACLQPSQSLCHRLGSGASVYLAAVCEVIFNKPRCV